VSCGATDARPRLSSDHRALLSCDSAVLVLTRPHLSRDGCLGCGASVASDAGILTVSFERMGTRGARRTQ
jgi:hypothetical protein